MFNAELLTSAKVQDFIKKAFQHKWDALKVSTALAREFSNEERAAIMDYMELVPKFREKFFSEKNGDAFLLCDRLALEQSTAFDIGHWKSALWLNDQPVQGTPVQTVHDLCCGMGGDSFFLPDHLNVIGVDLDENRLAMYRYNAEVMRPKAAQTICADVREVARENSHAQPLNGATPANSETRADFFTIDPARRAIEGENQRDLKNLTPSFEEVLEIAKHYRGGMAKLPPSYPTDEIPDGTEILYLGSHGDCRECLVLFGELAKHPDTVRAVIVDKNGETVAEWSRRRDRSLETLDDDLQEKLDRNDSLEGKDRTYRTATSKSDLPLGEISTYIAEPAPVLIRSHLFNAVATVHDADAHLISEGIAYVTSEKPLPAPGFACYEVLAHTEIASGAVRAMLKAHDVGKLTLKLRGVKVDPDAEIKRLKPKGKNSAILFYTRAYGEKIAILTVKTNQT
ncbi:MAG: hypothetical protein K6E57_09290 [Fibrobacter sp.]|nr:hypothetical protein [Fibrobacter sp.]